MKVAFFGTPAYALPTLDALVEAGHEVHFGKGKLDNYAKNTNTGEKIILEKENGTGVLEGLSSHCSTSLPTLLARWDYSLDPFLLDQ